jgi:hypothetical protein
MVKAIAIKSTGSDLLSGIWEIHKLKLMVANLRTENLAIKGILASLKRRSQTRNAGSLCGGAKAVGAGYRLAPM